MFLSGTAEEKPYCLTPLRTFSSTGGWRHYFEANTPFCKTKPKSKQYKSTYVNLWNGYGEPLTAGVKLKEKRGKYQLCACFFGCIYCERDLTENDFKIGPAIIYSPNTLQKRIEYSGKSKNTLKFTYSEFLVTPPGNGAIARQAFTRDFEIDLDEGNVAAYKGAILEIQEATNVGITYKVIRGFQ